jgi:hypothetical protein
MNKIALIILLIFMTSCSPSLQNKDKCYGDDDCILRLSPCACKFVYVCDIDQNSYIDCAAICESKVQPDAPVSSGLIPRCVCQSNHCVKIID